MKTYREPTIGYEIGIKIRDIISFIYQLAVGLFMVAAATTIATFPWWITYLIEYMLKK